MAELQSMNSEYPEQLEVMFCIEGKNINPDELTVILNIKPLKIIRRNDERKRKDTGEVLGYYTESYWVFSSYPFIKDTDVNVHLEWIFTKITPHKKFLSALKKKPAKLFIEVSCKLNEDFLSTSYLIKAENLSVMAEMGVDMGCVFIREKNEYT